MWKTYILPVCLLMWIPASHSQYKAVSSGTRCSEYGSIANGEVKTDVYSGQRKFKCKTGYKLLGSARQECSEDGQWQPSVMPTCVLALPEIKVSKHCGEIDFPNANVHYNTWDEPRKATVICDPGFSTGDPRYRDSFLIICTNTGLWMMEDGITPPPQCLVKRCPLPPIVPHAMYRNASVQPFPREGSQITYVCHLGYVFVEPRASKMTCRHGAWIGPIPRCVQMQACDNPPTIAAGFYHNSLSERNIFGRYYIGSKVTYACREGFRLIGDEVLECLSNKEWSSIPPRCISEGENSYYCNSIGEVPNGHCKCHGLSNSNLQMCMPFYQEVTIECSCNSGYTMEGSPILTCVQSSDPAVGLWDHSKPYCAPISPAGEDEADSYSTGDITDSSNHVSTLVIVIATACSVLGVLLLIMVIVVFRRRKPRPHLFHPGTTPLPYSRVQNNSMDEHDRLALMAYADATRVHLPTYEEAMSGQCRTGAGQTGNTPQQSLASNPTTEFRPLPSIPPTLRTNPTTAGDNTNRHSTVTTSTINRDGTSEIFGSLDTVNVSMSDASTSVTVETYDSGTSVRSIASQEATAGSFTTSDDNLANDDAPLLDNNRENQSDSSSNISVPSQETKEE